MKKRFLIHTKTFEEVPCATRGKLLPILENNTLEWAKEKNPSAYESTIDLKNKVGNTQDSKYFKYLRRLLELRLEEFGSLEENKIIPVDKHVLDSLNIETLRLPEFLSVTQIQMWQSCKRKWYWRYALGIKKPKSSALVVGSSFDAALNFYWGERKNGNTPPITAVNSAFYEAFDKEKEGAKWEEGETPAKFIKMGPKIIRAYLDAFAEKIDPVSVQHDIKIHLDRNGLVVGAIDVLENNIVVDNKTSKEPWETEGNWAKHKKELQPPAYSLAIFEETGKLPEQFKYCIVTKEEQPQTQFIAFEVKKYEMMKFKELAQQVWDEIQESLKVGKTAFIPEATKEKISPLCCKKYCEFSEECIKDGLKISSHWDKQKKCHVYEDQQPSNTVAPGT